MKRLLIGLLGSLIVGIPGCVPDDQRTDSVDPETGRRVRAEWPVGVAAAVDSGNVAMRAGDANSALAHYRRAVQISPENAPGWFGVYMAERELGNQAAADSALETVMSLAPGASLVHPSQTDTSGTNDDL
jgi:tetratricopeptide (TPR) repeat protein